MNIVVIGGAGFIGCNVADHYLQAGDNVTLLDNFSRRGTIRNLQWLQANHKDKLRVVQGDIRIDRKRIQEVVNSADVVFHFAAQVAVTTSVVDPREDFEINALGTFNVLEAVRNSDDHPTILFSSTNKVYGGMEDVMIVERNGRYEYADRPAGISEEQPLDFHSPYGCSKGTADQYVRDYARIYGLKTVVFRQSCIYGYRQFGVEDQGWVAHFTISASFDRSLTIYGNGKQIRDLLFITDLVNAYDLAVKNINVTSGKVYNIGGGPRNTLSLLELLEMLQTNLGKKIKYKFSDWRPGDQPVFICNIDKAKKDFNWEPKVGVDEGVKALSAWVLENRQEFHTFFF
ncbi:MAG: GDP-mannose 4,6-dehydratase [Bacteroidetes bacterium]|nr:GDP-mannose 4,6-dehydratase [Bacteroidota bacterium]MCL5737536.1 GDP-mannose 4,6-dehydratase [Bacteroidota bacterium]